MYIPVQNAPGFYSAVDKVDYAVGRWNTGVDIYQNRDPQSWVAAQATMDALIYGELVAWDPIKRQRAWQVRHRHASNGGVLSTAGQLVFQGTRDGLFVAYDATDGNALWEYQSDSAILAGPISYELDGEQYVAVAQGAGGAAILAMGEILQNERKNSNKLLVFKKGDFGRTQAVANTGLTSLVGLGHEANTDPQVIDLGEQLYERNCSVCHGISAKSNGVIPDLRYMSEQTHTEFLAIAFGGVRAHQGMVGFHKFLDVNGIEAIHAYLDHEQDLLPQKTNMSIFQKVEYWIVYWGAKLGEKFPWFANATRDWMM
jgi:hypothetical protein